MQPVARLGELLTFISKVAISNRMHTLYNKSSERNNEATKSAMWFSDMLHNLWVLGDALSSVNGVTEAIDAQISYWERNRPEIQGAIDNTISCYGTGIDWSLDEGVSILTDLKNSMEQVRFRGLRIIPNHEGVSLLTYDSDQRFNGKSQNIEFLVYAKDIEEANSFAQSAFGLNNFAWD